MIGFDWRILFRSEKGKMRPTLIEEVEVQEDPASSVNKELEEVQDNLSLRLMRNIILAAQISGETRESVTKQVALLQNAGS
jgi:hypothetical protein